MQLSEPTPTIQASTRRQKPAIINQRFNLIKLINSQNDDYFPKVSLHACARILLPYPLWLRQRPVSVNDGGVEKSRRFGKVSKKEMDFILGYCAAKGYNTPSPLLMLFSKCAKR